MLSARFLLGFALLNLLILVVLNGIASLNSHIANFLSFLYSIVNLHLLEILLTLEVLTEFIPDRLHTGALSHVHAKFSLLDLVTSLL